MYNYDEFRKWAKFIIGESFDDKWSYYQTLLKVSDKIKESIDSPSSSGTTEPTSASGKDGNIYVQTDTNGIVAVWFKVGDNWEASPFAIVSANPSGDATSELTKLEVDGTIYSVTTIEGNPTGEATADLTKLNINGTVYGVSNVKANPSGEATSDLSKLEVNGTVYGVASGVKNELIYQGTADTSTITLAKSLANYDYVYIKCGYSETGSDNYATAIIDTASLIASIDITTPRQTYGIYNDAFYYYFYVTSLTEFTKHANTRLVIQEIYGIKL